MTRTSGMDRLQTVKTSSSKKRSYSFDVYPIEAIPTRSSSSPTAMPMASGRFGVDKISTGRSHCSSSRQSTATPMHAIAPGRVASTAGGAEGRVQKLCNSIGETPSIARLTHRKSAVSLHPGAMYRLGLAELNGNLGLSKKPKEGVKWLKRSAEHATVEFPHALHELALLHEAS